MPSSAMPPGRPRDYLGIVIDISERKLAEQTLQRVNRQLRMISECNRGADSRQR
jgi:PAS domain-containing protein